MTTTPLHSTVKLSDPGDVLAAVPHMVGFHPTDSLVLITVHRAPSSQRLGMTLRIDLPVVDAPDDFVEYVSTGPISSQDADAVILAVVGGRDREPSASGDGPAVPRPREGEPTSELGPPFPKLIDMLGTAFEEVGLPVLHAVWTPEIRTASPWCCYTDDRVGKVPDPGASPLAAAMAVAGSVTFAARKDLVELLAPEQDGSIARRSARLDAMYEDTEQERTCSDSPESEMRIVLAAIRRTAEGSALTEDDLVRVLIALSDHRVRDLALGTSRTSLATAAEQLWVTLVRKAPSPELAEVASLLAFSAYLRGDGALAGIALERIEGSRPQHSLGALLRQALSAGLPPSDLEVIADDAASDAQILIDEDGAC